MTAEIRSLSPHDIDQIAAGEVVERPASVVKELLDNALDAGAHNVQIDLEGGGLERITVTDDGQGMDPDNCRRAVLRHATSKLRTAAALPQVATAGFRGEALAAICAVSRMTLVSRPAAAPLGLRLAYVAGALAEAGPVGCPVGTHIEVAELFYNTPARRKFMRARATEQAHCVEAALRSALGGRPVGLVVTAGSRRLLDLAREAPPAERLQAALGGRVGAMRPFSYAGEGMHLTGHVGQARLRRGPGGRSPWLFVNGRWVRDRLLLRAIGEASAQLGPAAADLVWVLHLSVAPEAVDVNVHPQKCEVRFSAPQAVYHLLQSAICAAVDVAVSAQAPLPAGGPEAAAGGPLAANGHAAGGAHGASGGRWAAGGAGPAAEGPAAAGPRAAAGPAAAGSARLAAHGLGAAGGARPAAASTSGPPQSAAGNAAVFGRAAGSAAPAARAPEGWRSGPGPGGRLSAPTRRGPPLSLPGLALRARAEAGAAGADAGPALLAVVDDSFALLRAFDGLWLIDWTRPS